MNWEVKYRKNVYDDIHYVSYPYLDHRGFVTDPYELWRKDFINEYMDDSWYDYLGAELID